MTSPAVSVAAGLPTREIAEILRDNRISAVPVVDSTGAPIGMVSEGDLIDRNDADREARRDWWLTLFAEGESLNPEFLASLRTPDRCARDVMRGPVITVDENTDLGEIARLLTAHRIKRVPVLRDGRVTGIVSRADLVRALAAEPQEPVPVTAGGVLAEAVAALDRRFLHRHHPAAAGVRPGGTPAADEAALTVADFRDLVADYDHRQSEQRDHDRRAAAEVRRRRVAELIDRHISDTDWRSLLHQAREAAEHGQQEFLLLRFPAQGCSDGGRAINSAISNWPASLRGKAAEVYLRWQRDLKPRGFQLAARILDFPGGLPGDIGLFLVWSGNVRPRSGSRH